jgi:kinesin family protein 5
LELSRPQTPVGVVALEKDKREDFLRTEKNLSDALVEKELALVTADKLVKELREELAFLKEQEASVMFMTHYSSIAHRSLQENKSMSTQLNELRP